jgi:hypothetical protein
MAFQPKTEFGSDTSSGWSIRGDRDWLLARTAAPAIDASDWPAESDHHPQVHYGKQPVTATITHQGPYD